MLRRTNEGVGDQRAGMGLSKLMIDLLCFAIGADLDEAMSP
ncbi:hypothetical protein [Mesorhizobium sp.]|nr:hypothetical protein [Mesorhizobium sp.]